MKSFALEKFKGAPHNFLFINYNTIKNYILIVYELSNFD